MCRFRRVDPGVAALAAGKTAAAGVRGFRQTAGAVACGVVAASVCSHRARSCRQVAAGAVAGTATGGVAGDSCGDSSADVAAAAAAEAAAAGGAEWRQPHSASWPPGSGSPPSPGCC